MSVSPPQPPSPGFRTFTIDPQLGGDSVPTSPWNTKDDLAKWSPQGAVLTAGQTVTFHVDYVPESWIVSVLPAAGVFVRVYPGSAASGPGLPGTGGAKGRIPANGSDLTVVNAGANPATVIAIATVKYQWLSWECGTVA